MSSTSLLFHVTGLLQAALFILSISAVYLQLQAVRGRRMQIAAGALNEAATYNLSFVAIGGSFLAFFSFFLLSAVTVPFASYIYWTRVPACCLALALLKELSLDRSGAKYRLSFVVGTLSFLAALIISLIDRSFLFPARRVLEGFVLLAGAVLVSGQVHQLRILISTKQVGALSLRARVLNFCKDLSTVIFSFALGLNQSWSLMVVSGLNAIITSAVIVYGSALQSSASMSRSQPDLEHVTK